MTCQVFGPCLVQKSTSVELRSTQPRPSKHLSTDQLPSDSSHRFLFRMMLEVRDSSFVSNVLAGTFFGDKVKNVSSNSADSHICKLSKLS